MTRREEILVATLDLASEYGLRSVSLAQIAERVGMRKPSLYNHFKSKDDIVQEAYRYLREQARAKSMMPVVDLTDLLEDRSLEEILLVLFDQYCSLMLDEDFLRLFKVLYAERTTNAMAATVVLEETDRMVDQVAALFQALCDQGKMQCDDVDMAALSFALTIHGLVDRQLDELCAQGSSKDESAPTFAQAKAYISWFSNQKGVSHA